MQAPIIYWFRNDLRITDNPALHAAAQSGQEIICVYIHDQASANHWQIGRASQWWLHFSLTCLSESLKKINASLILKRGDSFEQLSSLIEETNATALYFARQYDPYDVETEKKLNKKFAEQLTIRRFKGYLLYEPDNIVTGKNEAYKVFTPFYKTCLKQTEPSLPLPAPTTLNSFKGRIVSDNIDDWNLSCKKPDWAAEFDALWTPGEEGAREILTNFINLAVSKYNVLRNRPDVFGTSRLSPHLHFGEISPRQIWHAVKSSSFADSSGAESHLRQLVWRDFAHNLLMNWPIFPESAFKEEFNHFPSLKNEVHLKKWQQGQTGYPIVDAGMRQLWRTGWMHNRVRMIVASFLIKDLLISWQEGQKWFWDTLLDANLANNAASWQWVAGCGADAAPYFRIFNPVLQGNKFDPQGAYIKEWVPELARLPIKHIHSPWLASDEILEEAGVVLGTSYPHPIVDHAVARERALGALETVKQHKQAG